MENDLPSIAADLDLICDIAAKAGDLALPYFNGDHDLDVTFKAGNSPVSAADFAVNEFLMAHLRKARPTYGWLSEETLDEDRAHRMNAPRTFVVDPIDGTRGFIQGLDMWCISVAIVEKNYPIAGVLVCPVRNEVYKASRGDGAFLNGHALKLGALATHPHTIGGPRVYLDALDQKTTEIFLRQKHVPSLAYRIAMVANGRMAATFVKPNAHDWDIAAADLILSEAGGTLCDENGEKLKLNLNSPVKPVMLASHSEILPQMLAIVTQTPFG